MIEGGGVSSHVPLPYIKERGSLASVPHGSQSWLSGVESNALVGIGAA